MRPLDPRLLRHAAAARRFVGLTAGLAVVTAVLVIVQAQLLATTLDRAFLGGMELAALAPILVGLLAVVIGRSVLTWAGEVTAHRAAADVIRELRSRLVAHVLRLGPRHRDVPPTGELAVLATRGLDGLEGYFSRYLPTLLIAAVVPAMVAGRILFADWVSGLVIGLTVPLIPLFMILVGLHTQRATSRQWRTLAVLAHHFLDVVAGLDTLVAFGRARIQAQRLRALAEQHRTATLRTLRIAFLSALVLELLATLSVALVAVSIGLRLVGGQMDFSTALLVLILAPEVYLPLRAVGARFHDCADGLASAAEVFAVLETPAPDHQTRPAPDPAHEPLRVRGLRVAGRSGPVLDELDFDLKPGTVLGVAGPSGCGKSTLLELLLGLRTPDHGKITVGNVDLADVDRDTWLRRIAWVPQHPVLLAGSVADNIALADPTASPEQVRRAAALAALDVPLDTPVGEGGTGLSTGQQRRVALARAVLADRPLLLLDEPTEGVDSGTEAALIAALPEIVAGRSVVLVSHRPEVLRCCHRVLELPAPQPAHHGTGAPAAVQATGTPTPTAPCRVTDQPITHAADRGAWGAVRWSLAVACPQHARLVLAVLLGSAALGCGIALTATSAWLISAAALHPPVLTLMVAIVAVRAFGLGKGLLRYAERLVSHDAALRALSDLRIRIWNSLVRLGPAATARIRRGDLLSRLIGDVDAQQDLLIRAALPAACAAVVGTAIATGLGAFLPAAGLIAATGLIIAGVGAPIASVLAAQATERRTAALRADVLARTVEVLDAASDLLAFGAAPRRQAALDGADRRLGAALRRSATARGLGAGIVVLAIGITTIALTAVGIAAVSSGALPGPALAVLTLTPLAAMELVTGLPDAALRLITAVPAARRLAELEAQPAPVADPALPAGAAPPQALAAQDLAVRWPGADRDAVTGVNLTLSPGIQLALTGASGSGKSTLVAALLRTLDPSAGAVLADGRDARELTGDEVRSGTAWCGARTHLFTSTLRANLLLARPDAADTDLVDALYQAQLGDWFAGLPDGLDTPLGEYGSGVSGGVSGGERQRLGVARALLADRPLLLFDEPTAHLDAATADALAAELRVATSGRTALIVTHRPEQIRGLPQIRLRPATAFPAADQARRTSDVVFDCYP